MWVLVGLALAGCIGNSDPGHMMQDPLAALAGFTPVDRSPADLPDGGHSRVVELADGDTFDLRVSPVQHELAAGHPSRMLAYNGQLPGPTIRVPQHANVTVHFTNGLDVPTTVHWHGLRLDVAYDGVPHAEHDAVASGHSFDYRLRFPDAGVYWYHPHVREDIQQDMGLAGIILVRPAGSEGGPREVPVVLDDVLLDRQGAGLAPLYEEVTTAALMGRYGNRLLVNMDSAWEEEAAPGERVRLHLVDAANARPFNLRFIHARGVELIALDGGFLREPTPVTTVQLAPGERATVDILMPDEGTVLLQNDNGVRLTNIGRLHVNVSRSPVIDAGAPLEPHRAAAVDMDAALLRGATARVVEWELDVAVASNVTDPHAGHAGMAMPEEERPVAPIEWESDDPHAAMGVTNHQVRWIIRDVATGRENDDIALTSSAGEFVRLKLHNLADGAHPMQHPVHLHGQRFLVTSIDGMENPRLAWKDTVLGPAGSTVEILVEMSNPGEWMAHCHVSEHMESGMHTMFRVR